MARGLQYYVRAQMDGLANRTEVRLRRRTLLR